MPMPRPDTCVTLVAVEKPGSKMHCTSWSSVGGASAANRPCATAFARIRSRSRPAPSSASSMAISLPTCRTVRVISPVSDLPAFVAHVARLDAVVERVAQQVLERAGQLFQHRAVELGLCAADLEIGALVELLGGPAQDPVQPLGHAAEGHRADREQLLLDIARKPRLRDQRGVGHVEIPEQRLLDRRYVVDALGERARELLEARVPVELERIESLLALAHLHQPRLDLRLGLNLDLAHLRAQPDHAAGQLEQVGLERAQLDFDARAGDRDFAGFVDEAVDGVGAHAEHRAGAGLDFGRFSGGARGSDPAPPCGTTTGRPAGGIGSATPGVAAPAAGAAPAASASTPHSSATLVLPSRNASSTYPIRSRSASRASKSSDVAVTGTSSTTRRDSIRCASSPRRIAPAIRALPFNVCSVRRNCRAPDESAGARRHPRTCSPACG